MACVFEKYMLILTTSVAGTFALLLGLDYWVKSDLTRVVNVLVSRVTTAIKNDFGGGPHKALDMHGISIHGKTWAMLAAWAVISVLGILCQLNVTGKNFDHRAPRKAKSGRGRRGSMQEPLLSDQQRAGVV